MKRLSMMLALLLAVFAASAGIGQYYTFSATTAAYTPITGTTVPDLSDDDALSAAIDLGISFPYGTQYFQQIKISTNGWIGLGTAMNTSYYTNNLPSTALCPLLAPLWDDLSLAQGNVQYQLTGTVPNRVFVVQFTNAQWDYSANNQFSFQVRLHENGRIQFHYGPSTGTPIDADASIGINMSPGGSDWFYSVTPGTPATASTTAENNTIDVFPSSGEIYEFTVPQQYTNDLACASVSGSLNPVVNAAANYTVGVANLGLAPQTNYTVKLFRGAGIEIGSQPGTAVQPNQALDFTFAWTPAAIGPETLYGRVILPGDENTANDQSEILNVVVQPAGISTVTIGAGNEMARMPMDFYWKNSLYECLYYPGELNFTNSTIYALSFYNDFDEVPNGATKIWLGTTNQADLTGGWIPSTSLTSVFDGVASYPLGENTVTIQLQNPFPYISGNLVLLVNRPMDADYYSSSDYFLAQSDTQMRSLKEESDSDIYDPANPPAGTTAGQQFPKTTIHYAPGVSTSDPGSPAAVTRLIGSQPNPFASGTSIQYSVKASAQVRIGIYNVKGQLVRTLVSEAKAAGTHSVAWNGTDERGRPVANGIYFCRLNSGKFTDSLKLILIK